MSTGRGAASIQRGIDNGIGVFRVGGVVTPEAAAAAMRDNRDWLFRGRMPAQIVCYESADMRITPAQMAAAVGAAARAAEGVACFTPTAVVVEADLLPAWRPYCWMMAQAGAASAVFASMRQARHWATEAAALWAAQRRHRQHVRSLR